MENGGLERLVVGMKESLERELGELRREMRDVFAHMSSRFDAQAARLDRHAGLWQAGTRWSARMDAWAEKVDSALDVRDQQIAELRERIERLERNRPN